MAAITPRRALAGALLCIMALAATLHLAHPAPINVWTITLVLAAVLFTAVIHL